MVFRAILLLILAIGLSIAATLYFGQEVLIALGLIATQAKVIAKKLSVVHWPVILVWLKTQTVAFFRVEILKKWLMSTVLPLMLGRSLLRRLSGVLLVYLDGVRARYERLMGWFAGLSGVEKALAWLILLFATLAMSVTSLGLWLILFSVQLPLWLVAAGASFARMIWTSLHKSAFKAIAFLQLSWVWRAVQWLLPSAVLERKRRAEFRIARAVVRRRRLTIRQLAERKDRLPFRLGVMVEYLFGPRG